jgi:hypothetical protein
MNLVIIVPVVGRIYFSPKLWVHVKLFVLLDTIYFTKEYQSSNTTCSECNTACSSCSGGSNTSCLSCN